MKKILKITFLVLLWALVGWRLLDKFILNKNLFSRNQQRASVAVEISPVLLSSIDDIGQFSGSLLPWSQYTVAPKVTGRLEQILVNIGDEVRENQLLAVLDDDEYFQQAERAQAELEVAKANVDEAKSSFDMAERDLERVTSLQERSLVSEADLDAAGSRYKVQEARYKVAVAQVAQREASLKEAQVRLSYTKIRLSSDDTNNRNPRIVGERFVDEGALVGPNTPIVSILDIHSLKAAIYVIERDYPKVQIGMEATVNTDAYPGMTFPGKIIRIAPLLKETSRAALVEVEIPNPDLLLKPGMFVRVQIVYVKRPNTIVIPISSLARREGAQGVFLADTVNMLAKFIPVQTGIMNVDRAEIISPNLAGNVVTMGHHLLEDGAPITIPEQ